MLASCCIIVGSLVVASGSDVGPLGTGLVGILPRAAVKAAAAPALLSADTGADVPDADVPDAIADMEVLEGGYDGIEAGMAAAAV